MKASTLAAERLFEANAAQLMWQWIAGQSNPERRFDMAAVEGATSGADLVGYLNYIHPFRVQILGWREVDYLNNSNQEDRLRRIRRIIGLEPPALVLADGKEPPPCLIDECNAAQVPLFRTAETAAFTIDVLRTFLSKHFANRVTRSGSANLNSAISANSGHEAGPSAVWREGVLDVEEICAAYPPHPHAHVQGPGGRSRVA